MEAAKMWSKWFGSWPDKIPRRGMIVTNQGEQIPFKSFMISDSLLLLERTNPDPSGSRFVLLGFSSIDLVKLIDALEQATFTEVGFLGKFAGH